jgi:iron complex transport system ATP-binding protein
VTAVAVEAVSVALGGARILDGVSAEVAPAEWVTLIGPNGAGKSTLLRALAGLVPYLGSIRLDATEVSSLGRRDIARRLAFVPQAPLLPPEMRVHEYVLLGRNPHIGAFSYEGTRDLDAVHDALDQLDLEPLAGRALRTLSGGEAQRVVLARALAQDAPLLLLDEPTAALDLGRQQQVLELVAGLRERGGLTVLAAMHDLTLAAQYSDRLLLLSAGELVAAGPPEDVATEELVTEHYGASVRVLSEPGLPVAVVPVRRAEQPAEH